MSRARTIAAITDDVEADYADPFAVAFANLRRIDRELAEATAAFVSESAATRAALRGEA
jgi:hypothetical protein